MLVVETIARIRRDHLVKGVPIKKIARDLRVSKNTVRKVVRGDETSYSYERKILPMPKLAVGARAACRPSARPSGEAPGVAATARRAQGRAAAEQGPPLEHANLVRLGPAGDEIAIPSFIGRRESPDTTRPRSVRCKTNRRRVSKPCFLRAQARGCCRPLGIRQLAREAPERQCPSRTCRNCNNIPYR